MEIVKSGIAGKLATQCAGAPPARRWRWRWGTVLLVGIAGAVAVLVAGLLYVLASIGTALNDFAASDGRQPAPVVAAVAPVVAAQDQSEAVVPVPVPVWPATVAAPLAAENLPAAPALRYAGSMTQPEVAAFRTRLETLLAADADALRTVQQMFDEPDTARLEANLLSLQETFGIH
jgi:hypothetical protein